MESYIKYIQNIIIWGFNEIYADVKIESSYFFVNHEYFLDFESEIINGIEPLKICIEGDKADTEAKYVYYEANAKTEIGEALGNITLQSTNAANNEYELTVNINGIKNVIKLRVSNDRIILLSRFINGEKYTDNNDMKNNKNNISNKKD